MKSTRNIIATATVVGAFVLIAFIYFIVLPATQASSYKKSAEAKHHQVNDKLLRVYDSFKRPAFTNSDTTPEADKTDIQMAKDAIKDAQTTLENDAPAMTKFSVWPLLGWNQKYKQATDTAAAEQKYVNQAKAFLADYQILVDYCDKTADIGIKVNADLKDLDKLDNQPDPSAMAAMIDADVAKVQPLVDEYKAVNPPSYLKANTDTGISDVNQVIYTLQDMSAGIRDLDIAKLTKAATDATNEQSALDQVSKNEVDILQHKSPMYSEISQLRVLDSTITAGFGKL